MLSNNILLEVIHKDKFSKGRYKEPKISLISSINENNRNSLLAQRSPVFN